MQPMWILVACSPPPPPAVAARSPAPVFVFRESFARHDACADGDPAACVEVSKGFGGLPWAFAACELGVDDVCADITPEAPLNHPNLGPGTVSLALGCSAGSPTACARFRREGSLPGVEDDLAAACADGHPAACDPTAFLRLVDGPVVAIERLGRGAGSPHTLWTFDDGWWLLRSDSVGVWPLGAAGWDLTFAPIALGPDARTGSVRVYDRSRPAERGQIWQQSGEVAARCSDLSGPWTPSDDCRSWSLGKRTVVLEAEPTAVIGGAGALWARDAAALHFRRPDEPSSRPSPFRDLRYADDELVVLAGDPGTAAFDRSSGVIRWTFPESAVGAARSPDGRWLATASPGLAVRDAATGEPAYEAPIPCSAVAWTAAGDLLCADDAVYRFTIGAGTRPASRMPRDLPSTWPAPAPVTLRGVVTGTVPVRIAWDDTRGLDASPDQPFTVVTRPSEGQVVLRLGDPVTDLVEVPVAGPGTTVQATVALVDAILRFDGCNRPVTATWASTKAGTSPRSGITDRTCELPVAGLVAGAEYEVRGTFPMLTEPLWTARIVARAGRIPLALSKPLPTPSARGATVNLALSGARGPSWLLIGIRSVDERTRRVWRLADPAIPIECGHWRLLVFDGERSTPWFETDITPETEALELPTPTEAHVLSGRLAAGDEIRPIPDTVFEVVPEGSEQIVARFETDLSGRFTVALPYDGGGLEMSWPRYDRRPLPADLAGFQTITPGGAHPRP